MGTTTHARRLAVATIAAIGAVAVGAAEAVRDRDSAAAWREQGRAAVAEARALAPVKGPARNVIVFIGDGMGVSTVTAARILDGQQRGQPGEENQLAFERLPHVALVKTYETNQQVAESAGTATAIFTGVKTRADVIGLDASAPVGVPSQPAQRLRTLFEWAEARGLATGVVTTARLTHATPAAAYAHTPHRDWECDADLPAEAARAGERDIATQLVELSVGDGIDVALGGGRAQFLPEDAPDPEYPDQHGKRADGRDLAAVWQAARPGRAYVWNRAQLSALDLAKTRQILGLFEPSHMQYETDRARDAAGEPSLAEMTSFAIDRLARERKGYVLMVEGGRIDHGHHAGSAYLALNETIAFSAAVDAALARVNLRETLVVVTADHSHVLTIGGYPTRGNPILGLVRTNDERGEPTAKPMRDAKGRPFTTLGYANGPGYVGASGRPDLSQVDTADPHYRQESTVPLDSESHGGEDVPLYAGGPGAQLFHGVQEQSYIYYAIVAALGW
jgi:alkaline phosphatase